MCYNYVQLTIVFQTTIELFFIFRQRYSLYIFNHVETTTIKNFFKVYAQNVYKQNINVIY